MVFRIASSPYTITSARHRALCCWCCSQPCQESQRNCGFWLGYSRSDPVASVSALLAEALVLKLRKQSVAATLKDNSALLTGLLLAVSIPPLAPWWMVVLGTVFAVIIAKQLYGVWDKTV